MRPPLLLLIFLHLTLWLGAQSLSPASPKVVERYGKLPLSFEVNQGQTDAQVKYLSRGAGYSLFLTSSEAVLTLRSASGDTAKQAAWQPKPFIAGRPQSSSVLRLKLLDGNPKTEVSGQDELPGKSNYFIGNDPSKWHTNIRQFGKVRYVDVYPAIDLVYYGHQRELEYDFVLHPGATPRTIRLGIEGAKKLRLEHGDLVVTSAAGEVRLCSPRVYQDAGGKPQRVRGRFVIRAGNEVGFDIGTYDRRRALVIDPVLVYSTFLGGTGFDSGWGIAVDSAGNAYVTGIASSADFPTLNPIQPQNHSENAFVTKMNSEGTGLVYSTYLGGSGGATENGIDEGGRGIAVDAVGDVYVTGATNSNDFPTVKPFQSTLHAVYAAFVTKINAAGNGLVYSTYLGGSGAFLLSLGNGIAVDTLGHAYVAGQTSTPDFPTANAIQPTLLGDNDAFVTKLKADGSGLVYSTYLGGTGGDLAYGIAVDGAGNAYITGSTQSNDFPTAHAIQPAFGGQTDAFITKIRSDGGAFIYSTYLGGSDRDTGKGVALDTARNAYVTGVTWSTDFPVTNAIQPTFGGGGCCIGGDAFVTKISAGGGALVYSTYLGGGNDDRGSGITVDSAGNAYVTGLTNSGTFPIVNAIQTKFNPGFSGWHDAFVTKISAAGNVLVYSTYLGDQYEDSGAGIAVDQFGSAYVTGSTKSGKFPTTPLAFQRQKKTTRFISTGFVAKIATETFISLSPAKFLGLPTQVIGTTSGARTITLINNGTNSLTINKIFLAGTNFSDFEEANTCGTLVAAGASCTISVTFTPRDKNLRRALLALSDSDPTSPQTIGLSGTGTAVSLSTSKLIFADQAVATTSASLSVTLTNVGSTVLNFTAISIIGTNPDDFSQTNNCGTSIVAGASCKVTMTFKPTAVGKRIATLTMADDGGASPQTVHLVGTGT